MFRFVSLLLLLISTTAFSETNVNQQLLERIAKSKQQLMSIEKQINQQSLSYQKQINQALNDVKALREKASAIQRVADEQILSVEQLSQRVEKWRAQDNYQKLLLQSYFEQNGTPLGQFTNAHGEVVISENVFNTLQNQLVDALVPRWQPSKVVDESGEIAHFNVLEMGPISLAYNQERALGGLVEQHINQAIPSLVKGVYRESEVAQLAQLNQTGLGTVMFDPTLGNASKLQNKQQGIIEHIKKGGVWALPILFFGALSFVVAIIKAIQLLKLPSVKSDLTARLSSADELRGAEHQLVEIAKNYPVSSQRDDQLVAFLMKYRYQVENYLGVVATSAAIAPLLGLLGTVSGMINTFMMMNTFGTGDAATVSGGISEALVTTELGLIVAIPSLILSALLSRKAKSHNAKLEANAIQLSKYEF
ncbi:MotA/TolQ/ExbB proton channel family protein [Pseudoalteromonas sp. G4]|uniref:MotA/TolQ/ExbB proton channel family protein n=1 Tax=Pseudoalteromonas sp. G4 TaxID=2992761 RepID=UPI00237DE056|nr:MotA/TolQ/ExbB proton channel family protein [Pseudoalteromonas sp. G4]MDE3270967.1 MotA/TolQ/ExbB proton channel family protein [Pseudoalteromonas sp. G4]